MQLFAISEMLTCTKLRQLTFHRVTRAQKGFLGKVARCWQPLVALRYCSTFLFNFEDFPLSVINI